MTTVRPFLRRAVAAVMLAGLTLIGPAATAVLGHAQLVTSTPGSGEVVTTAPTELRLLFSEPIDASYTKVDILDANGKTLAAGVGGVDPADATVLVVPLTLPGDGLYTVDWRSLSAADGHTTSGFFTFGVGDVAAPSAGAAASAGSVHAGHDAATTLLETEGRAAAALGAMVAFALPLLAWVVLRAPRDRTLIRVAAAGLLVSATGALVLLWVAASTPGIDPVAFVTGGRAGQLLLVRTAIGVVGGLLALGLTDRRPLAAARVACVAGALLLVAIALGGHAAAYRDPVPVLVMTVHLGATAIWAVGVLLLAWTASAGRREDRQVSTLVPRFSALAVVAVGLIIATGGYADWIQTGTLVSVQTPYETTLLIKIVLVGIAFLIGASNLIDGGRDRPGPVRFRPRILVEASVVIAIVIVTAILSSGSPPGQDRPVEIAVAPTSALRTGPPARLGLAPGRPGPTQFVVVLAPGSEPPTGGTVELALSRLDGSAVTRIPMRADPANPRGWIADGGLLPADSRWDATLVIRGADTIETGRTRFVFALDADGISEGRATPPVDPVVLIALALLVLALLGAGAAISGVAVPHLDRRVARGSFGVGAVVAGCLGLALLLGGSFG